MEPSVIHIPVDRKHRFHTAVYDLRKWNYGFLKFQYAYVPMKQRVILGSVHDIPVNIQAEGFNRSQAKEAACGMALAWLYDIPPELIQQSEK